MMYNFSILILYNSKCEGNFELIQNEFRLIQNYLYTLLKVEHNGYGLFTTLQKLIVLDYISPICI